MQKITSIEQLIDCFESANSSEKVGILKCIEIPKTDFEKLATWEDGGYTRNCLVRRDEFEFILLCWDIGAKTPMHGHDGQDCWMYQASGSVQEKRFTKTGNEFLNTNKLLLKEGKLTFMHDRMGYHIIENVSDEKAMSLHVYANPIDRCKVYNEITEKFEVREMQYDSIVEEVQ